MIEEPKRPAAPFIVPANMPIEDVNRLQEWLTGLYAEADAHGGVDCLLLIASTHDQIVHLAGNKPLLAGLGGAAMETYYMLTPGECMCPKCVNQRKGAKS